MAFQPTLARAFGAALILMLMSGCTPSEQPTPARPTPQASTVPLAPAVDAPVLLARGLEQRSIGNYDQAAQAFHQLTTSVPNSNQARQARYYLAESFVLRERWTSAADALRAFLADGVNDALAAQALFLLARSNEQAGAWAEAAKLYAQYRALGTPLAPYAQLREAAQQQALGQNAEAAASYAAVAHTVIARGERAGAHEKAIALYRTLGQNDAALKLYAELLGLAEGPEYRVRILGEASTFARSLGALEQARTWERELVSKYFDTGAAQIAVESLRSDQAAALAPSDAARVYEANERFAEALPLLDAALTNADAANTPELRRRRALTLRATGNVDAALNELASISAADPNGATGRQALLDLIQTRGQTGDTVTAIAAYRQFAQDYPTDINAPEALNRVAQLLERQGDSEGAIQQRLELGQRFPTSELGQSGLAAAAWHFYRNNRASAAHDAWVLLANHAKGSVAARAAYWAARTLGPGAAANQLLDQAAQVAPNSYYGVRAAEQQHSPIEATTPLTTTTSTSEWQAAETWLAAWSNTPVTASDSAALLSNGAVQRALALAEVDLHDDAIAEWNEARATWNAAPKQLYLLARLASDHGQAYIGIKATEDVLALAPTGAPPTPVALQRLRFPTPYAAQVAQWAATYKIDPRAVYAMLRQESLFNPSATSWVGARGLAQVMPETAQGIASRLKVEDYSAADLYRPTISIRFGAAYLSDQVQAMNGSLAGGLAAYNGGLGNAMRWAGGETITDQDSFVETIDYPETESYVKLIYSYYAMYHQLYATTEGA